MKLRRPSRRVVLLLAAALFAVGVALLCQASNELSEAAKKVCVGRAALLQWPIAARSP